MTDAPRPHVATLRKICPTQWVVRCWCGWSSKAKDDIVAAGREGAAHAEAANLRDGVQIFV